MLTTWCVCVCVSLNAGFRLQLYRHSYYLLALEWTAYLSTTMLKLYVDLMSQPSRALYIFLKKTKIPFETNLVNLAKGTLMLCM